MTRVCRVGDVEIGPDKPLAIIGGPCALESRDLALSVGRRLRDACAASGLPYIFKASYDKANRTSAGSPRGPGLKDGLDQLAAIGDELGVPVTTDVHEPMHAAPAAEAVDMLQVPAFLCRQTDLLTACAEAASRRGCAVNVKKGQFVSPAEMAGPVRKLATSGCDNVMLTERGTFFGYHRLVNDFIGVCDLMELDAGGGPRPVCFDCTHSTQLPGASSVTGGRPERAAPLARAAVAVGVHAVFLECHPAPAKAISDGATMLTPDQAETLIGQLATLRGSLEGRAALAASDDRP